MRKFGSNSYGVELGNKYRINSRERGLHVVANLDELNHDLLEDFNLITMAHVLEHLTDPVGYLRQLCKEWLKKDGNLLIEVLNLYEHSSLEFAHLTTFSVLSLRSVLNNPGYQVLTVKSNGQTHSHLISLYLTMIVKSNQDLSQRRVPYTNPKRVFLYRRLGLAWRRFVTHLAPQWAWLSLPELFRWESIDQVDEGKYD